MTLPLTVRQAAEIIGVSKKSLQHWLNLHGLFRAEAPVSPGGVWLFDKRQILILAGIADLTKNIHLSAPEAIEALRDVPAEDLADSGDLCWCRCDDADVWTQEGDATERRRQFAFVELNFAGLWEDLEKRMEGKNATTGTEAA